MTVSLLHSVPADGSFSAVGAAAWDAQHVLTQATDRLLGRTTAGVGATEEISVGAGLTLSGGTLVNAGATSPIGGSDTQVQFNDGGVFAGNSNFTFNKTTNQIAIAAGTAAAPTLIPTGDTNTGMWFPAADTIAWSTAGSERARIDSNGNFGIGATALTGFSLRVSKSITGSGTASAIFSDGVIQSDANAIPTYFLGLLSTAATSFTVSNPQIFRAAVGTIGAGSSITNLYGFVNGDLTAGTNNYGFHSGFTAANVTAGKTAFGFIETSNIATGGGTTWAFYAQGTAPNYFNGQVQLGAGAVGTPSLAAFGDTNTGVWFPAADTIAFSEGGVEAARINSSGQFLVGGTTADAKLTVTGVGTTSTTPSTTTDIDATLAIRASNGGAGNGGMLMFGALQGYFGAIKGFLQNGSGPLGAIDFYTRNASVDTTLTQRMRINYDGRIGIGTGSPDALLSVNGVASFGAGTAALPSVARFGDLDTGMWFPAANTLAWSTGGSERMRVYSSGGVSIGNTTDPGSTNLSVSGNIELGNATDTTLSRVRAGTLAVEGKPLPYVFAQSGAAVSVGAVTTEVVLATITIPGGAMGPNGWVVLDTSWSMISSANSKITFVRVGGAAGTAFLNVTATTIVGARRQVVVINNNSQSSQKAGAAITNTNGVGYFAAAGATATVDTSAAWDLVISGQKAVSGDTLTLEGYQATIYYGA